MTRIWKLFGLHAVLAAVLTAAPSLAAEPGTDANPDTRMDTVLRQLEEIRGSLKAYRTALDISAEDTKKDIKRLEEQIARLQRDVDGLRGQGGATARVATYPPNSTGRIRLLNRFVEPVDIAVNRTVYQLQPGEARVIDNQPAGPFNYEVLGVQSLVSHTLVPNETFTIDVYPR